jgi:glycosyltransferase involved in cell wall biosynthesis
MKICVVSPEQLHGRQSGGVSARVATALASDHEVVLIRPASTDEHGRMTPPDSGVREVEVEVTRRLDGTVFSCPEHRLSAAVLATIADVYGEEGPDLLEVLDRQALGLMPLQARRCGAPLFERTLVAVRLTSTIGIDSLHDGRSGDGDNVVIAALERQQLRLADVVLWPGGDGVRQYRDFYGLPIDATAVVPDPHPVATAILGPGEPGPLRMLFLGPLARRAGAIEVAEACLSLPVDEWTLTFAGSDTDTAPAGQSTQLTIESMFGGDSRVRFVEPETAPAELYATHDLAIAAPRGGAWLAAAVEAMRGGLPLLATPVGGLPQLIEAGGGWSAEGVGVPELGAALAGLVEDRPAIRTLEKKEAARAATRSFVDPRAARAAYAALLERHAGPETAIAVPRSRRVPLVTGVIPYYKAAGYIKGAVDSLLSQTHRNLEVVVVNDGSFDDADGVLAEFDDNPRVQVVTQLNRGDGGARNLGLRLARGDFVTLLDSDNEMEPEFVSRALAVFDREPDLAYVSCWLRFVSSDGSPHYDPAGYAALGSGVVPGNELNWDGDTLAVLPRAIFHEHGYRFESTAGMYSDWELYRRLHAADRFGTVIPEYLARYRFVPDSVSRGSDESAVRRSVAAARDRLRASSTVWEAR